MMMRRIALVLMVMVSLLRADDVIDGMLDRVVVKSANSIPINQDVARSFLRFQEGDAITSRSVTEDVKRLFDSKHFADVSVAALQTGVKSYQIVYTILAKPRIKEILVIGSDEISRKKILAKMTQNKRESFQESKISADMDEINKIYEDRGYHGTVLKCLPIDSLKFEALVKESLEPKKLPFIKENIYPLFDDRHFLHDFLFASAGVFHDEMVVRERPADGSRKPLETSTFLNLNKTACASGMVHLIYLISEKPRFLVRGVDLVGAEEDPMLVREVDLVGSDIATIGKIRKTHAVTTKYSVFSGYVNDYGLDRDAAQIKTWYWDHGYFDAEVTRTKKTFDKTWLFRRNKAEIEFVVAECQPYRINSVTFTGNTRFTNDRLKIFCRLKPGDLYGKTAEEKTQKAFDRLYFTQGYLDFTLRVHLIPNVKKKEVAVNFEINEGRPSRVRNIYITGNTITRDNVLRREISLMPGDLADKRQITSSKSRLKNLGYFKHVNILDVDFGEPGWKDLRVIVQEGETGSFGTALSYSDDDTAGLMVEFGQRNFDLFGWDRGFRGGGQRFKINAMVGDQQQSYGLNFTEPWLFNRRLRFDFSAWRRFTGAYGAYEQRNIGEEIRITKSLPWKFFKVYGGHRFDEIEIDGIDEDFSPEFIYREDGTELTSNLLVGIVRDSRNRFLFPEKGSRLVLGWEYQSEDIGSYVDAYKFDMSYDYYLPIFKSAIARFSTRAGHVNKLSGDDNIRIFDRYFAGGTSTLRGFDSREVGPVDPSNGEPVGGKSRMLLSTEVVQPVYDEMLYVAGFVDAGNVWAGSWGWEFDDLNVGAGVGLRIRLPIGATIGLDYGWPLVTRQIHLDDHGRFHFTMGYRF